MGGRRRQHKYVDRRVTAGPRGTRPRGVQPNVAPTRAGRGLALLTIVLAGCLPAACSLASGSPGEARDSVQPRGSGEARGSGAGGGSASAPTRPVTLAFGGDIHFADYLAPLATNPAGLTALRPLWGDADLRMANLETAITEQTTPFPKAFNFKAPASALETLAGGGLSVLTQANNHAADYGAAGLTETLAARAKSPVPIVGIGGEEKDAFAPRVLDVAGLKVAVLGATQVAEETLANFSAGPAKPGVASSMPTNRIVAAVTAVRDQVDVVVVYLHWGIDYQECPDQRSTATAADLEKAGADVIVGAHSHRVGGAGWLGRAYVDYGLGNFVWWRSAEPDSRTGILTVTVDPVAAKAARPGARTASVVSGASWRPLLIGRDGIPAEPPPADRERLHALWEQASACSGLQPTR